MEIVETFVPASQRKTVERLHIQVDAEKIEGCGQLASAAIRIKEGVIESVARNTLTDQPSPNVRHDAEHRIDFALFNETG